MWDWQGRKELMGIDDSDQGFWHEELHGCDDIYSDKVRKQGWQWPLWGKR